MTKAKPCSVCGVLSTSFAGPGGTQCQTCRTAMSSVAKKKKRAALKAVLMAPVKPALYVRYVPAPEPGYTIRNDGHKHIPSRGIG